MSSTIRQGNHQEKREKTLLFGATCFIWSFTDGQAKKMGQDQQHEVQKH